jgi:hypothetical protein
LRHKLIAFVAAVALAATSSPAALAQPSTAEDLARARELFVQGTELRDAGDTAGGLEKLKAARDLAPNPITAFELGRTYMLLGMPLEAREAFLSVAAMPAQPDESARAMKARQDAAKLADDAKREIDRIAESVKASTPAIGRRADSTPALSSIAPASPAVAAAQTEAPQSKPPPESRGLGLVAYAGLGFGAVSFIAGGTLTFMAISKATSAQDACSSGTCPPSAASDLSAAKSLGFASILFYAMAAGGVAVGVVDVVLNPPRSGDPHTSAVRVGPRVAPGWAGVGGSF